MYLKYMCILLYVKVIWYKSISRHLLSIGVCGVGVDVSFSICAILLYVTLLLV